MERTNRITYIANAGVMIESHGKKILIDALNNDKIPLYKTPSDETKEKIIRGIPPFDGIDAMLFTHHHSDHFDADSTIEFLRHNKETIVLSTAETILRLKNRMNKLNDKTVDASEDKRLFQFNPSLHESQSMEADGIHFKGFAMLHEGKEYEDVQNLAFLIDVHGMTLLHVGDAKPCDDNFDHHHFHAHDIDLLIAPFPYVGILAGRRVVNEYIQPRRIAALHFPSKEMDVYRWIDATKRSHKRVEHTFIDTVFFEELDTSFYL